MNSGRLVIFLIFGLAILATAFAWTFRKLESRRVLELWGGQTAANVRTAKKVFFLELGSQDSKSTQNSDTSEQTHDHGSLELGGQSFQILKKTDVTQWPGLINARAAVIADASFDWQAEPSATNWPFALQFENTEQLTTIGVNLAEAEMINAENQKAACLGPKIVDGLKIMFDEFRQFGKSEAQASP